MPDNIDGVVVVLLPSESDPIASASSEEIAHVTMAWLGKIDEFDESATDAILAELKTYAASADGPITAAVDSRGPLGDDDADVVFLAGDGLMGYREGLIALEAVGVAVGAVEQFPDWKPHVTLGYPDSAAAEEYESEEVVFDRLALWSGDNVHDFALGEAAVNDEDAEEPSGEDVPEEDLASEMVDMSAEPVPWHGVLAPIETMSGDMRIFSEDSITAREFPLPLKWMKQDKDGHDDSIVVANITKIWEEGGLVLAEGMFATTPEAEEVINLRVENMVRGVSVDLDAAESQIEDEDGNVLSMDDPIDEDVKIVQRIITGRIASATICAIPAFQEAYFDIGTWEEAVASDEECVDCEDEEEPTDSSPVEASAGAETFAPGTRDGPGWITDPVPTARIRKYWVRGKGAAKIRWGQPGDFNRCRTQLAKYVQNPQFLAGTCANMHKEALGVWPGGETGRHSVDELVAAGEKMSPAFTMVEPVEAMTAAVESRPHDWFSNPELKELTPLTITADGRVFGHAAGWGTCHVGMDKCVTAPKSPTNYAYFHVGAVKTDDGEVPVGHITMNTGHAALSLNATSAAAHYDHTGAVVADVSAGEDKYGIWFSGAIRRTASDDQVEALRAAGISGDWRRIGAGMELVAALAVNTPGFPVPRTALAASGLNQDALVAAAVVANGETNQDDVLGEMIDRAVRTYRAEEARELRVSGLRAQLSKDNEDRMADLRARLEAE